MSGRTTLRRQVLAWVSIPLGILWLVSAFSDYDIAKRFVNGAYDRALLESALDIGARCACYAGACTWICQKSRCRCCAHASRDSFFIW
jgi:hypothetical protein